MKKKKDYRVWSEFGRATNVNGVIAIQNLDRHDPNKRAERKAYLAEWWKQYMADAPNRRAVNPTAVCRKCWEKKATDGSDGLGGFTPDDRSASGWTKLCRMCRATIVRDRRNSGKAATGIAEDV